MFSFSHWCFQTVVLEKTLGSPLESKITPVNPKGYQPWILIGGTDAEAEAPILRLPAAKTQRIRKDPDAGKDWRREEKWVTEDEMAGWHHRLDGHQFEQALGDGDGQGSLGCCSPWGLKESDTTERLNNKKGGQLRRAPLPVPRRPLKFGGFCNRWVVPNCGLQHFSRLDNHSSWSSAISFFNWRKHRLRNGLICAAKNLFSRIF